MFLKQIADPALAQYAYLVGCQRSGEAILIDPERDLDRYFEIAEANHLKIVAVAETHIHADYLSGAREFVERHGVTAYLSAEGGRDWQFEWPKSHENARFLKNGDSFKIGKIGFEAIHTPGHTPEHLSFLVTDFGGGADKPMAIFSGDFLFVGDVGRPDLLESAAGQAGVMIPAAKTLYESLRNTQSLPEYLQVLPAHGAGSACGKSLGAIPVSVLGYERRFNVALRSALESSEKEFVDAILSGQPEPPPYFARMKRENREGPALLKDGKLPRPDGIGAHDLANWVDAQGTAILDLRADRRQFMERHLRGAIHAPLNGGKLTLAAGSYVPEGSRLLLVSDDSAKLEEAIRQLVRIGLDEVAAWIPADESSTVSTWTSSIPRITTADLARTIAKEAAPLVLDVRGAEEFASGHVGGAINIPYSRLAVRLGELPERRPVFVHCASGLRAAMAASYIATHGIDVIHVDGNYGETAKDSVPGA